MNRLVVSLLLILAIPASAKERIIVRPNVVPMQANYVKSYKHIDWQVWETDLAPRMVCDEINQQAGAVVAWPDQVVYPTAVPNDSAFSVLWHHQNTGQAGGTPDADTDATDAWDIATSSNVRVGIVDTGVIIDHVDLAANIWTNPGEVAGNGLDDDGNGYIDDIHGWDFAHQDNDPTDFYFSKHGTNVAGVVGAVGNNSIGVTGVCWDAEIVPLKVYTDAGAANVTIIIEAYEYAIDNGIKVTNNSFGTAPYNQPFADAIAACTAAGILTVAAQGNNSWDVDCCPLDQCKFYPAAFADPGIVAVGASGRADDHWPLSDYGSISCDLFAPGVAIVSTTLNGYASNSGTSLSSPMVAGAIALLWNLVPGWTAEQVKARLMATVDQKPAFSGKCVSGGRLNIFNMISGVTAVEPSGAPEALGPERVYDVQGRRVDQTERSGVTFGRQKRVRIR